MKSPILSVVVYSAFIVFLGYVVVQFWIYYRAQREEIGESVSARENKQKKYGRRFSVRFLLAMLILVAFMLFTVYVNTQLL